MRHEFEMVCHLEVGLQNVQTHEMTCAVELEPDESTGTYYVARTFVEGATPEQEKRTWHQLTPNSAMHAKIALYAYQYCLEDLEELWEDWLSEHPTARKLRSDAEREHSTHS